MLQPSWEHQAKTILDRTQVNTNEAPHSCSDGLSLESSFSLIAVDGSKEKMSLRGARLQI